MNFRVDLSVQKIGRETGGKIDLGLDAGACTEGTEKGMGTIVNTAGWLPRGFWCPG